MSRRNHNGGLLGAFFGWITLTIAITSRIERWRQRRKAEREAEERWASYLIPDELIHV